MIKLSNETKRILDETFWAKGNHIIYKDTNGKFQVDQSKLKKVDNRNFVEYVKKALSNWKYFNKIETISGYGYDVIITGMSLNKYDVQYIEKLFGNRASITDNLMHDNRDQSIITIKFNKNT